MKFMRLFTERDICPPKIYEAKTIDILRERKTPHGHSCFHPRTTGRRYGVRQTVSGVVLDVGTVEIPLTEPNGQTRARRFVVTF
jgi:hypothetical protein